MYAHELFEQNKPRVVVTYPGRFQPFHQGHAGVFSQLQKKFGAENVYIATSNDQSSAKSPFNFSDKYQLMTAASVPADKIIQTNAMYALPEGINPANTIFITAVGAPDADRLNPDTVLKRDKKDKDGNVIKPAGSPGYYKIWDSKHDSLTADQHGYVIVIPEIKKSVTIKDQTYDVSHGTETRNLWNRIRDDDKARSEFLSQMYGKPSQELANIFDKIPQATNEDIVADNGDSTSPIHGMTEVEGDSIWGPQGRFAGDTKIDVGGIKLKPLAVGDIVKYFGEKAKILALAKDQGLARVSIESGYGGSVRTVKISDLKQLGQGVAEGWSQKYKSSINCSHPKGFSQKAHCAGKKKHNESVEMEMTCPDCGMCETHGDHSQDNLEEACWKGYHKEGMKTMFGKRYPNCVKNTNEEQELDEGSAQVRRIQQYLNKEFNANLDVDGVMGPLTKRSIEEFLPSSKKKPAPNPERTTAVQGAKIKEQLCPECGGPAFSDLILAEKQDACYHKVKSRYKVWPSAYASGALVQCRKKGAANWGNKSEGVVEGYDSEELANEVYSEFERIYPSLARRANERTIHAAIMDVLNYGGDSNPSALAQDVARAVKQDLQGVAEGQLDENLKKWFKEKWVRFGPDGKIRGACARGDSSEGKPKCLPQSKAHALGKKGRASAAAKKRREDPNPERKGPAINVATKTNEDASGVIATKKQARDPRYSMSLTKDVRPGQIEKSLRAFKLAEQQQNNNAEMFDLFAKFLPLAMKDLGLTTLPKIVPELRIESHDGQATFGRFVNDEMSIHLALANRHPVDILRTLAHELVHFKQLTLGKIKDTSGITGSPEENQANTIAGIIMRHFNKKYPDAVNMQPIGLDESLVTVNYGIGKNPGKLAKVGPGGRVPHAKLHVNVDKKTAKKLGIPHLNENGDDEADEVEKQKNLIPFPKGTVKVDVSDVYDWYKLGMEISDLDDADPADFGKGPPQTVMAFGDEEQEHKYLPQLQRLGLKTHDIDEAAQKCPPATQDITLNLKNRQKAIDEYGYGPLNPDLPNRKFWMKKVDEWNLDSMEEAQSSLCGNCAAFDIRQETLDCIAQGIDSDSPQDAEGVIDAGELGYCKFLKFKCASRRTCDAWVTGGPLQDKPVDENFADGRNPGDKGSLKAKVKGKVTMSKARAILKNKNSTPRAKQLAHWFINMNKGRNK